jgi:hypothetical protein
MQGKLAGSTPPASEPSFRIELPLNAGLEEQALRVRACRHITGSPNPTNASLPITIAISVPPESRLEGNAKIVSSAFQALVPATMAPTIKAASYISLSPSNRRRATPPSASSSHAQALNITGLVLYCYRPGSRRKQTAHRPWFPFCHHSRRTAVHFVLVSFVDYKSVVIPSKNRFASAHLCLQPEEPIKSRLTNSANNFDLFSRTPRQ